MKHSISVVLIALLSVFTSCNTHSKKIVDNKTIQYQQLDSLFNYSYSNGLFNGAILVTKQDTIIYKKAFGYANEATKENITPESLFYIASVSKQFTAMGIMMLQEQGKLSYEDNIEHFFPDYPDCLKKITVRQLLNHTSGLTDTEYYTLEAPNNEAIRHILIQQETLELESGTQFRYSNSGYVMLALIIQKVSGIPIDQFFHQTIFAPLKMNHTTASRDVALKNPKKVEGYNLFGENVGYKSAVIGPGGIYSTIEDLEHWNNALNTNTLVSKETLNKAFTNGKLNDGAISITINGQDYGYGFGWLPYEKDGKKYVQHDGSVESYRSLIKKNLTDGYDYIFLTNHGSRLAFNELTTSIDAILEKGQYTVPKIPITNTIVNAFLEHDVNIVRKTVKNRIAEKPEVYTIDENSINRLAYTYLRNGEIDTAIQIFLLNTELYPNSANAFDSLAEGYFSSKDYELSKKNYKTSLELNPKSESALKMLKRINKITLKNNE